MKIICTLTEKNLTADIIGWTVPFLLGLFASFLIDIFRKSIKNKRNRNFVKLYLKNTILPVLIELEKGYRVVKDEVEIHRIGFFKTPAFENFNTNVLKAITPLDYYEIFKKNYILFNEIETMIHYLSLNLPMKINNNYWKHLDDHLILNNIPGDHKHFEKCEVCLSYKTGVLSTHNDCNRRKISFKNEN